MATTQKIAIEVTLDGSGVVTGSRQVTSELNSIGSVAKQVGVLAAGALAGFSVAGFVGKMVSVQREFDVLNSSLITVAGSSAAAEREMVWIKEFAATTPFGLAQATEAFVRMKSLGLDPTRASLNSFGNTASAMGKDMMQFVEAVADASSFEFERLREFGITAKQEANTVSLTFQGVTTKIGKNAQEITKYLTDIGNNQFATAMTERAKTLDGAISELDDTWDEMYRTVSSQGAGTLIYDTVKLATGAVSELTAIIGAMKGATDDANTSTGAMETLQAGVSVVLKGVAIAGATVAHTFEVVGTRIGQLAAQAQALAELNFSGFAFIGQEAAADIARLNLEFDGTISRIINAGNAAEDTTTAFGWQSDSIDDLVAGFDSQKNAATGAANANNANTDASKKAATAAQQVIESLRQKSAALLTEYELLQRYGVAALQYTENQKRAAQLEKELAGDLTATARKLKEAELAETQRLAVLERAVSGERSALEARKAGREALEQQTVALRAQAAQLKQQAEWYGKSKAETEALTLAQMKLALAYEESGAAGPIDAERLAILRAAVAAQTDLANESRRLDISAYTHQHKEALKAAEEQAELLALEGDLIGVSTNLRERLVAQRQIEIALARELQKIDENAALDADQKALRKQQATELAAKQSANAATEAGNRWREEITDSVVDAGREAWLNFGDEGIDAVRQIGSTLKSAVMDYIYQLTLKPILVNVVGSLTGGGAAGGLTGAAGTSWGGVLNAGQSIWSAYSGSLVSGLAGAVGQLGSLLGSSALNSFSMGMSGLAGPVANAGWASAGGLVGTALPWVAGAAALWSLISSLDGSGDPHSGAVGHYQTGFGTENYSAGATNYNSDVAQVVEALAGSVGASFDAFLQSFGYTGKTDVAANWADDFDGQGESWGGFVLQMQNALGEWTTLIDWAADGVGRFGQARDFAAGEDGYNEYIAAVAESYSQGIIQAMQQIELPSWISGMLDSLDADATIDEINTVLAAISTVRATFEGWGQTITGFAALNDDAISSLMQHSGGFDNLASNMSSYYDAYYSEQEKIDHLTQQMTTTLAQYGQELPANKEAYRALVEQTMRSGESGTELAAVLLAMGVTFAQVADATATGTEAVAQAGRTAADIAKERTQLERELLEAQGDSTALLAQQRAEIHESNRDLYDQIQTAKEASAAAQALAAAEQQLTQQRESMETQLLQAQGNEAAIRERTLAALPESIRWMQEEIWTLDAQTKAAQAAAAAEQQLAQEREAEQQRIASLSGLTAANLWSGIIESINNGDAAAVGGNLANTVLAGIETAVYTNAGTQIMQSVIDGVITPVVTAAVTGSSVSEAISGAAISNMLASANAAAAALGELIANPEWQATMTQINGIMQSLGSSIAATIPKMQYVTKSVTELNTSATSTAGSVGKLTNEWERLIETMTDTVRGLRGEISGTGSTGVAYYQSQYAIATAAAKAGDKTAAEQLPTLVKTLSGLYTEQAATRLDAQRQQAVLAQSLETTATYLAKQHGVTLPAFANGGTHFGGVRIVGERGPELELTGASRILSNEALQSMLASPASSGSSDYTGSSIRAMHADLMEGLRTTNAHLLSILRMQQRWERIGMPPARKDTETA